MTTPSIPSPVTWAPGPVTTQGLRDVTNGVSFLTDRPLFHGFNNTPPSVPSGGTAIAVPLDIELVDNWNGHTASDNSEYVCQAPGWYFTVALTIYNYTSQTDGMFAAEIVTGFNGGATVSLAGDLRPGGNGFSPGLMAFDLHPMSLVGTDLVHSLAKNMSGSTVSLLSVFPQESYMHTRWVAALSGTTGLPVPANQAWPVPPAIVTSSFLNANIRDTLRFLTFPPVFRGYLASGSGPNIPSQSFPAATACTLDTVTGSTTLGGVAVDNYGGWQSGSNSYRVPVAGVYTLAGQAGLAAGGGSTGIGFSVNSGTTQWVKVMNNPSTGGFSTALSGLRRMRLNAGDTVRLMVSQSSGSSQQLMGSSSIGAFTKLIVFWESA